MKPIQSKVGWKIFVFWWTASSKEEKGEVLECKGGLSEVQATGLYWPSVGLYNTMLHHQYIALQCILIYILCHCTL